MGTGNDGGEDMDLNRWTATKLSLLLFVAILIVFPSVSAQESDVCIVYFTGDACGDECKLTDSFMNGLINEYAGNLFAIKYNIDASQKNKEIFEAYRRVYNLPQEVPLLLFGKDDYLSGMHDIFRNTEPKIYNLITKNGTNCPLESGYVPPGELDVEDLPGEVEIYMEKTPGGDGDEEIPNKIKNENKTNVISMPASLEEIQKIYEEDPVFSVLLASVIILVVVFVALLLKRR